MKRAVAWHTLVLIAALSGAGKMALAKESRPSVNYLGLAGLNTVPSARMEETGTFRVGVSTLDPYNHAFIGLQVAKPLYINLRQSMLASSVLSQPERVYPGLDFKLRLHEEGRYMPDVTFGMNSVLGHQRFSSEYFALSKRIYDFDLTAGLAWGRLGSKGILPNPFKRGLSRFGRERDYTSEDASTPADWFSGEQIGFFGGVEYMTPVRGLFLKADYNGDSYEGERRTLDFKRPSPWSLGFDYRPREWMSIGAAMIGADKIMARLSFQGGLPGWKGRPYKESTPFDFSDSETRKTDPSSVQASAAKANIELGKIRIDREDFSAVLYMKDDQPGARQLGRAARHMAASAGREIETITIIPVNGSGLRGKAVSFNRRDLDQAVVRKQGSPEEIWRNVSFTDDSRSISRKSSAATYKILPELSLSLGEDETTHLYRTGIVLEEQRKWKWGFVSGSGVRLNLANNLHRTEKFLNMNLQSIRADESRFASQRATIDRNYLSWMKTIRPDFHLAVSAGYLEEMFAGIGGEILYRPFQSPFAVGAEAWSAFKRDPETPLALGLNGNNRASGHLNFYYDVPGTDITAFAKAGLYLAGDVGGTLGLQSDFQNGVKVKAFVTATNGNEKDVFGSDRNLYGGLQLSIPFGNLKYIPEGSEARIKFRQIGRDAGQVIDKPVSLYETTEPTSYRRLGRSWQEVLN